MSEWVLTFGVGTGPGPNREPHPRWLQASGDGYVIVEALDYDAARSIVNELFGRKWSMLYQSDGFFSDKSVALWRLGEIGRIASDGTLTWKESP
jgi:hypothetical protein